MAFFDVPALVLILGSLFIPLVTDVRQRVMGVCLLLVCLGILLVQPSDLVTVSGLFRYLSEPTPYGRLVAIGFTSIGILALVYGLETIGTVQVMLTVWAVAAAVGIAFAADFIVLFLFWELLTLTATGLVLLGGKRNHDVAFTFLFAQLAGGLLFLSGILLNYSATGSFSIGVPTAGLELMVTGIGFKTAFVGLHMWLPVTYPRAHFTASVLLSALTTKAGVYALSRVIAPSMFIPYMGGAMALYGVIAAIRQKNMRRLLSYHIMSQVGYMVAGVGLLSTASLDGAFLHVLNHMIYKALLFMCAGVVIYVAGTEELGKGPAGLYRYVPIAALGAIVGAASISGVPPFNGFVSKALLKYAVTGYSVLGAMLVVASMGTAISFCKFVYFGFFKGQRNVAVRRKPTAGMNIAIGLAATGCFALGLWPSLVQNMLPGGTSLAVYSIKSVVDAMLPITLGVASFVLVMFLVTGRAVGPSTSLPRLPKVDGNVVLSWLRRQAMVGAHYIDRLVGLHEAQLAFVVIAVLVLVFLISRRGVI